MSGLSVVRSFIFMALAVAATSVMAAPVNSPRICVFDPAGKSGELYGMAALYLKDSSVGQLRPYVDERLAVEDFKAGQCDGLMVSTFRARSFNPFVGSIDAFGALPSTASLKKLLAALNSPALAPAMSHGDYEVAGVVPLGPLYVLVRDRAINSIAAAAGKKVAVLDWDKSQARLVESLAAQPVAADVTSYAARFNNGQVDIIASPALFFEHFEVQKGLRKGGGVYRFPVAQMTATLLIRKDRFPAGYAAALRMRAPAFVEVAMPRIQAAEERLPAQYWMTLGESERRHYQQLLAAAREHLTDDGVYDPRMMALLHRLRCAEQPADYECVIGSR